MRIVSPFYGKQSLKTWKPILISLAVLRRLWWHTHAYVTIFAMMTLTLGALGFIHLYGLTAKIFASLAQENFKNANCSLIINK